VLVLGLSCYYHDSAVALVSDDEIIFAIQEERLSRVKHDARFPTLSISRALEAARIDINEIDKIVYYEDPVEKLGRLWDQVLDGWPHSRDLFFRELPRYVRYKLPIETQIRKHLAYRGRVECSQHHRSHAASTFYTSPFERAVVLTIDGVGERETAVVHLGEGNNLKKIRSIRFPDSLGLFYSIFTDYLGFEVNEGEYKVMGLAPYGRPTYVKQILGPVLRLSNDGSFSLNSSYIDFLGDDHHYARALAEHLDVPPRRSSDPMLQQHMDLAASVQEVLELALLNMVRPLIDEFSTRDFCFAGGVALNCTANARLVRELGIRSHIHAAAGDSGGALGAALDSIVRASDERSIKRYNFSPYLGVMNPEAATKTILKMHDVAYTESQDVAGDIANMLARGQVVAIVQGRDEWGPRALGARSILADPRSPAMKDHVNAKIKFREEFRPFAPVVKEERYGDYFETLNRDSSPYMLYTHKVKRPSEIASVVHVDGTSRVQTVSRTQNARLYDIIDAFERITGVPVLLNTSFNLRGEPMVSSASDALQTFFSSGIDCLAINSLLIEKTPNEAAEPAASGSRDVSTV